MESSLLGDNGALLSCCPTSNHSPTCLLRSTFTTRHLPSAKSLEDFQRAQNGFAHTTFALGSNSLPHPDFRPLVQAPPRPLPQVGSSLYGIQTSSVRDMPWSTAEEGPSAPTLPYVKRMNVQSLPHIQTAPGMQAPINTGQNVAYDPTVLPNSYSPLRYTSYPSPSSSLDAVRYASSPLETLASQSGTRPFVDPACHIAGDGQHDRLVAAPMHVSSPPSYDQRDVSYQRYIGHPPNNTHPWSRSLNTTLGPSRAPSSFSSDIEMASSINSWGEEDEHEGDTEQEITLNLGDNCARHPTAYPDVPDDAQLDLSASFSTSAPLSAFASVRIGTPNLPYPSADCALSRSPIHVSQLPMPTTVLLSAGSSPASTPFASDDISSGSDYEATIKHKRPESKQKGIKSAKKKAKSTASQDRQRETQKEPTHIEEAPIKRRRRTIQKQTGGTGINERLFQCEFCPMSFQRRHDMKR
jgi:hypothetical protein